MYLSSRLFFKTPHKTVKFHGKFIFQQSEDLNLEGFFFSVYQGATPQNQWTKKTVKKLNLWGKTAVDKINWIKAWWWSIFTAKTPAHASCWYLQRDSMSNHQVIRSLTLKKKIIIFSAYAGMVGIHKSWKLQSS